MIKRLIASTFLVLLFCQTAFSQEEKYIGLFVYNFTKYFDWPESAKAGDFIIEVIGHQSVYDELARITKDEIQIAWCLHNLGVVQIDAIRNFIKIKK